MIRKKRSAQRYSLDQSFHGYVIRKLKENSGRAEWSRLSEEEKTSLFSLLWIVYLDRLEYANYDIQPILDGVEELIHTVDDQWRKLLLLQPDKAALLHHLNRLNARQLELLRDNCKEAYEELHDLSQGMFERLHLIEKVLSEAAVDVQPLHNRFASMREAMERMADRFRYLALRHFYSAFKAGQYTCIAALCVGSGLIRAASGCLPVYAENADSMNVSFPTNSAFERLYDAELLCSFCSEFDFSKFDEETNTLLPEVVDRP